jgi:hypothetical protein
MIEIDSKCLKLSENVQRCYERFENVSAHIMNAIKMTQNAPNFLIRLENVKRCVIMLQNMR